MDCLNIIHVKKNNIITSALFAFAPLSKSTTHINKRFKKQKSFWSLYSPVHSIHTEEKKRVMHTAHKSSPSPTNLTKPSSPKEWNETKQCSSVQVKSSVRFVSFWDFHFDVLLCVSKTSEWSMHALTHTYINTKTLNKNDHHHHPHITIVVVNKPSFFFTSLSTQLTTTMWYLTFI